MKHPTDILHKAKRLGLLAAVLELQYYTSTAANVVPIPGGERVIAIGTPVQVRGLLADTPTTLLNPDELAALRRLDECAQDGEGYDVPPEMMARLAEIGVVLRLAGRYFKVTDFGMRVLEEGIMIEREQDRRRSVSSHFSSPVNDRRRPGYDRREHVAEVPMPGAVRTGFAEAPPTVERRRFADAGME